LGSSTVDNGDGRSAAGFWRAQLAGNAC
jgi:hypothetical protein